ncbi:MAG: cyclodeaminase/cyclohydrolase family protein [Oscillospiraceae bacterium]|jgi:formiminotetrahydrofolate cyclodeaminase|nr:cyclodeaminase/cyclohydrolase family protein [Oscillospiraceae bacterium]
MSFVNVPITEFVEVLASKAAVPGGGGASALVGAIGTALGNMVGSLTVGKKKYADVEADIIALQAQADALQKEFLYLVDQDAVVFEPLSKAYGIPKDDPTREQVMEDALRLACSVPMDIMRACAKSIDIIEQFAAKGSTLAISDAGVGALFAGAALQGASYNVYINTKSMTDRNYAAALEKECDAILAEYTLKAENISSSVYQKLRA